MAEEIEYDFIEEEIDDSDKDRDYVCSESSSDCESNLENTTVCRGRKRPGKGRSHEVQKKLKNSGESYKKYRGKGAAVQKRVQGPPCGCKLKCFEVIAENVREKIFQDFWKLGNYDNQNVYLFGCLRQQPIKRKTKKHNTRRTCTISYTLKSDTRSDVIVCKKAFTSILGIGRGRTEYLVQKLREGQVVPTIDQRGKHDHHKKKYTNSDLLHVKNFIDKVPKYESHYSRHKNPNKQYMSLEYSISSLYEEYVKNMENDGVNPVSPDKFRRIFTEEFNISFKGPKSDTCAKCDEFIVNIKAAKDAGDNEAVILHEKNKHLHQRKAEAARDLLTKAIEEAKQDPKIHVITFDLQQALPTPKLTTGPCFYKKKLWCYNFSVHCCHPEQGYFFLWDESQGKRRSDEITSCLNQYFEKFNISGDIPYAMSDNCYGQNKNWTIIAFWLHLLEKKRFKKIVHIFPQVGHTMLPSDRDFGTVEKSVRRQHAIYAPSEWENVLKMAQKKHPFIVTKMSKNDFFAFSDYRQDLKQPSFGLAAAVKLEFNVDKPLTLYAYSSYNGQPEEISLRKKGRPSTRLEVRNLPQKYLEDLPIDESKLNHVLSCLQWIPPVHHEFYYRLHK